jgi:hypothetical protein
MATEEELRHYAESLPPIYREILGAFPRLEPSRKQGYGLAFQTLAVDFERRPKGFDLGQIMEACQKLEQQGLVKIKNRIFAHPTPLGERLIGIITGQQAQSVTVEKLPSPPK